MFSTLEISQYADLIHNLFNAQVLGISPEKALFFFHQCTYDSLTASKYLLPSEKTRALFFQREALNCTPQFSINERVSNYDEHTNSQLPIRTRNTSSSRRAMSRRVQEEKHDKSSTHKQRRNCFVFSRSYELNNIFEIDPEVCCVCRLGGDLICCDFFNCERAYHLECAQMSGPIPEGQWECPSHKCGTCMIRLNHFEEPLDPPCLCCHRSFCVLHGKNLSLRQNKASDLLCDECAEKTLSSVDGFVNHLLAFHRALQWQIHWKDLNLNGFRVNILSWYKIVVEYGGIEKIRKARKWREVCAKLGIPSTVTNASTALRKFYLKYLLPYRKLFCTARVFDDKMSLMESLDLYVNPFAESKLNQTYSYSSDKEDDVVFSVKRKEITETAEDGTSASNDSKRPRRNFESDSPESNQPFTDGPDSIEDQIPSELSVPAFDKGNSSPLDSAQTNSINETSSLKKESDEFSSARYPEPKEFKSSLSQTLPS